MEWLQKAEGLLQAVDQTARAVKSGQQTSIFSQTGAIVWFKMIHMEDIILFNAREWVCDDKRGWITQQQ
jgi:hypothetical protein